MTTKICRLQYCFGPKKNTRSTSGGFCKHSQTRGSNIFLYLSQEGHVKGFTAINYSRRNSSRTEVGIGQPRAAAATSPRWRLPPRRRPPGCDRYCYSSFSSIDLLVLVCLIRKLQYLVRFLDLVSSIAIDCPDWGLRVHA